MSPAVTHACMSTKISSLFTAGLPYQTSYGGTSFVTTDPAPIKAPCPMVTPGKIVTLAPIEAPFLTRVSSQASFDAGGRLSFVKQT